MLQRRQPLYLYFIDFEKDFTQKLWKVMLDMGFAPPPQSDFSDQIVM